MDYNTLKISKKEAEKITFQLFNINGKATQLPGELDFNFKIKTSKNDSFILKISRPNEHLEYLDFQQKLLQHLALKNRNSLSPKVISDIDGNAISEITDSNGNIRKVRLLTFIAGRVWSSVNPQLDPLRLSLGKQNGTLTNYLSDFKHSFAAREFEWDVAQGLWTKNYLDLFNNEEKEIIEYFQQQFSSFQSKYTKLRKGVVHNDANDNNVIVSNNLEHPTVTAIIDFGDAISTQIINDVAITCAYGIMHHNNPLAAALPIVKGYHSNFNLKENELEYLYTLIAIRLVISVTKSAINKVKEPNNNYLLISEKPAWKLLKKWKEISSEFAHYSFRNSCGFSAHPKQQEFENWVKTNNFNLTDLFPTINKNQVLNLDLSVSSKWIGHEKEFNNLDFFQYKINELQNENSSKIIAGGYLEARPIYTSTAYDKVGNSGNESRTIHLGIDFWLPVKTNIYALFDGEVVSASNCTGDKDYGGLVILKHVENNLTFYSLYGHLSIESALKNNVGSIIKKGTKIAELGNSSENGNWVPHLHFQLMLSLLNFKADFPGVSYFNEIDIWKSICPNPYHLFKNKALKSLNNFSNDDLIQYRKKHLGKSLSLQYKSPLKIVRGTGQYLIDQFGRKYLDTVNNVAHVGHENYAVVKAGQQQMALLNTNTRYLNDTINDFTKELLETFPPELNVVHFVNSGSEANELAIRMAKAATGEKDIVASEIGYHGNSNMCVAISSYKFDGKGGNGAPKHTHIFPIPNSFRGKYQGKNTGKLYAKEVQLQIEKIKATGRNVCAFIIEPIISCGGQVELPKGFLAESYKLIKKAGGICISDEVQTGCGRMGETFWGFQLHNVVPDIVTIGKPLGNGHPVSAVVCTQEIATKFANGMEYFNTFGGNPVSCAIGKEVLQTIRKDNLQENALKTGGFLKTELKKLAIEFPIIGDVRGQGLFLGFELVDKQLNPLSHKTTYLINRMKDHGILMSSDGPDNNVLKIKPPIIFSLNDAKEVLFYLKKILNEDFMKLN